MNKVFFIEIKYCWSKYYQVEKEVTNLCILCHFDIRDRFSWVEQWKVQFGLEDYPKRRWSEIRI